jgi:hypothetical protein
MGKKITIGNSEGILLTDHEKDIKHLIIDYLYNTLNLSNLRYIMLDNISKLTFLQENDYYVSPNYKGLNYFLIFTNIMNKPYALLINRKKLSYHKNQVDLNNVFIVKLFINTNPNIYAGTIFDGKIIQKQNTSYFLIHDCYSIMGKKILDMEMNQKLLYINDIINTNLYEKCCNNFNFKLIKLYKYPDLPDLIYNLIPKNEILSNGLIFYPPKSGNCIIHIDKKVENIDKININSTNTENIESVSLNLITNFTELLKARTYSYEKDNKHKILYICKSDISDVYYLYDFKDDDSKFSKKNLESTDKKIISNDNKIGIAHIPNLKISHYCANNISNDLVKVNCVYYPKFDKWIPLNII